MSAWRSSICARSGGQDLAIPELEKIVALDPNNVEARANLGVLLFFKEGTTDAVPATTEKAVD